jgi:hypothetical protein
LTFFGQKFTTHPQKQLLGKKKTGCCTLAPMVLSLFYLYKLLQAQKCIIPAAIDTSSLGRDGAELGRTLFRLSTPHSNVPVNAAETRNE